MDFEEELARVLPADIPQRDRLIEKSAQHLLAVAAANEHMNLTRIASPREAAIKHVLDSVLPWRHFSEARCVLDAGTGAGFPGIPLSLALPDTRFVLTDSTQKKARFVESACETLGLTNVDVWSERAEELALRLHPEIITARAVAPTVKLFELFRKALAQGSRLLLYKGPEVEVELAEVDGRHASAQVLLRYELPDGLGGRTLVSVAGAPRKRAQASPQ